ncbi:hypothetical protein BR93DRAFT_328639 [Coniochaeta sp. PMI_546]|nr:hypothetical protein BR93DRAFT_328639 [Coniochaeta sp. PMI_546]
MYGRITSCPLWRYYLTPCLPYIPLGARWPVTSNPAHPAATLIPISTQLRKLSLSSALSQPHPQPERGVVRSSRQIDVPRHRPFVTPVYRCPMILCAIFPAPLPKEYYKHYVVCLWAVETSDPEKRGSPDGRSP